MSILIKGMEMPKDGEMLCVGIYPDGKVCINLDLDCKQIATAIHIQPHGRLIDANALKKNAYPFPCAIGTEWAVTLRQINDAQTIIPAEEGE